MMFQAFACDSITVPACPLHNTGRSQQDQSIIAGFLKALDNAKYILPPDVKKAIDHENQKSTFGRTKRSVQLKSFFRRPRGKLKQLPKVSYIRFSMEDWICQLTAGLVFDAIEIHDPAIRWDEAVLHSPDWFQGPIHGFNEMQVKQLLADKREMTTAWETLPKWLNGWSARPKPYPADIYRFYIAFEEPVCFKHVFYNSFTWYIGFECSEATRKLLSERV